VSKEIQIKKIHGLHEDHPEELLEPNTRFQKD
jgi:hypothetical protein